MTLSRSQYPVDTACNGDADVAAVASLLGDRARARILLALAANEELSASALATQAGLSAPATSAHLQKLLTNGLIAVARVGRNRYYRIAKTDVAAALEILAQLAPTHPVQSLRQCNRGRALHFARICYDHLAGRLSVDIIDALIAHRAITAVPGPVARPCEAHCMLGPRARFVCTELGVSPDLVAPTRAGTPLRPARTGARAAHTLPEHSARVCSRPC
jgi:DNA-binding transcriptional ArsR family regulator